MPSLKMGDKHSSRLKNPVLAAGSHKQSFQIGIVRYQNAINHCYLELNNLTLSYFELGAFVDGFCK